jgi:hypothetical protein
MQSVVVNKQYKEMIQLLYLGLYSLRWRIPPVYSRFFASRDFVLHLDLALVLSNQLSHYY